MMNLFIDCGAHKGLVSKHFLSMHSDYFAVLFEPNPNIGIEYIKNSQIFRQAVWTQSGIMKLWFDRNGRLESSSLFADKKGMGGQSIDVRTVDFAWYIDRISPNYEKIVVKMDIEGAEYDVLNHLIKTNTIMRISELYVEWHWKKVRMRLSRKQREHHHNKLLSALQIIPSLTLHGEYGKVYNLETI